MRTCALKDYKPPADGEPLDAVQEAFLRALVPMLVDEVRKELAAARAGALADSPRASETQPADGAHA